MRVAYVCADPAVPVFGSKGSSVQVQGVVAALRHAGCSVDLFAARRGGEPPESLRGVLVEDLPSFAGGPAARGTDTVAANAGLAEALSRGGPFDLVYERHCPGSFAAMEHARSTGVAGLLEVDAPVADDAADRALRAATAILAVSHPVAASLRGRLGTAGRVHLVSNGVDPARFPPGLRASRPAAPGIFTVGFVGSLEPWHDYAVLAEALRLTLDIRPCFRLLVVGDGPARADLENELAAREVADWVEMTGAVKPAEVPGLLASMDAAVAPYPPERVLSFSPLTVYEYMAAGLPVVASRFPAIEEPIQDGVTGILCPPGEAAAFAAALLDLADKPSLRHALGLEARRAVLAEHTWARVAERILDLARTTPDAPRGSPPVLARGAATERVLAAFSPLAT
jgi:hypothetical protein